jgi:hypothetical protein
MKITPEWALVVGLVAGTPNLLATAPNATDLKTQMVITVQSAHRGSGAPEISGAPKILDTGDVTVTEGNTNLPVVSLQRLTGELAGMQLFVFLDDSTRSSSLSVHFPELKEFLNSLPATTQVAIGYMHNGTFAIAQAFTADHQKAADALRLPAAIPGENGSPYFALSDLAKHWPSNQSTGRRAVLMLTDGVDRYYDTAYVEDPYVDASVQDALKGGLAVYSIYLHGAGYAGGSGRATNFAQSRLLEVSQETGGHAYFQGFSDPVSIAPFLKDFHDRLEHQYRLTFEAKDQHGMHSVKLRTELPGLKIEGPSRMYVRD